MANKILSTSDKFECILVSDVQIADEKRGTSLHGETWGPNMCLQAPPTPANVNPHRRLSIAILSTSLDTSSKARQEFDRIAATWQHSNWTMGDVVALQLITLTWALVRSYALPLQVCKLLRFSVCPQSHNRNMINASQGNSRNKETHVYVVQYISVHIEI